MKNIFRIFAAVFAGVVLFASCLNEAAPLASSVSVDKAELNPVGIGAVPSVVKVTADGDWFAVSSSEWITVEPANGVSGTTEVTIKVADNVDSYKELCGPRSGSVSFCYGTSGVAAVTVNQKGENGLDASRTYSLVTKAEDLTAGSYIFVYDVDKKKEAMKPSSEITDSYYGYLMTGTVNDPVDNVITMPNGLSGFSLEAVEGGFKIKQADGRYLFQSGTYASFYATSDAAKAAVWAISFNEKGYAEVKNTTQAGQIMHFSSYGNVEATTKEVKDEEKPMLYKDAKPASDEVLSVENVVVTPHMTEAKLKITSNKKWSVRNHDSWITSFTPASGEGNGEVVITFDANSTEEDRIATFKVIGETTNIDVEVKQLRVPALSNIGDLELDTYSSLEGTVVAAGNDGGYIVADETGAVLVYEKNHTRKVGDNLYVEGNVARYKGYNTNAVQMSPVVIEERSSGNSWTYAPKSLDGAGIDALVGKDALCEEVIVKGKLTITVSGKYTDVHVNVSGASSKVFIDYMTAETYTELKDKYVIVKGYTVGSYNMLYILPYSVEVDPDAVEEELTFEGDGKTAATAYTIADAKAYYNAGMDKSTKVWVKGVIIGSYQDNNLLEGAEGASNSNMAIGTADSHLTVQLPKGAVRDALNLKDNPANLGKTVAIYGNIEAYFKVAGVKNVSEYEFE